MPGLLFGQISDEAHKGERIEVTGSNIKRVEAEGPAPLLVITREDIQRSAGQNLTDILSNLPIANVGSFGETNNNGVASVSLRGIGGNATLVLVNGRRLPPHGPFLLVGPPGVAISNLNAIPVSVIERIEVLKDGASAIYGSDAIGGVVNIILRQDFRGAEITAAAGQSSRGDTAETRDSITLGMGDLRRDGFNVMGTLDYYHRDALEGWQRERSSTADLRRFGGLDQRSPTGTPGTWLTAGGFTTNTPFPDCPPESRENAITPRGVCAFNQNTGISFLPRTNRKTIFGSAVLAFNPEIHAFLEASRNDNKTALGGQPLADNITLPVGHNSNPYPFEVPISYRWLDFGRRFTVPHTVTTRVVAGLEGIARGYDWGVGFSRSVEDNKLTLSNVFTVADHDALVKGNVYSFVDPSRNDPRLADSMRVSTWRSKYSKVQGFDAKISGPVFQLPNGPLEMAAGAEHRNEVIASARDDLFESPLIYLPNTDSHEAGGRTIGAVFGELRIPLPGSIEAQLAVRHERYSDYGGSTAPKVAAAWRPSASLLVRAGHATGFRAPSLVQLYTDVVLRSQSLVDTTRCEGYKQAFGKADARTVDVCTSQAIRTGQGGNPNLSAETSKSDSLGFVFEPSPGASVVVDFYRLRHRGRIATPDVNAILAEEDRFPGAVVRDPPTSNDVLAGTRGPLAGGFGASQRIGIFQVFYNSALLSTKGVDVEFRLRLGLGRWGDLKLESSNTYVHELSMIPSEGQPAVNLLGQERASRYRGNHHATWKRDPWTVSVAANVIGSSMQARVINGVRANVSSWTTVDSQVTYSGVRDVSLVAGARNLLDREPPVYVGDTQTPSAGFDSATTTLVGRFFYARATWSFR